MESKRLFIGGLYREINEADLRDRFKTFGTVSSVEIIRRTDDKGCPVKTFAYLDILQTESDFKRCVSLLSNSKWKGCCLKVQAAKESFLTRLDKERQQQLQANADTGTDKKEKHPKDKTQPQHGIPETVPKAVPGTPLPGKKNWVVGKFGRVLPVVYLRRRDRKKIAKFDPSKTTHCLKRINLEESRGTLSDLTWNLSSDVRASNGVSLQNEGKSKQKYLGVDSCAFHKNAVEKQGKKSSEKPLKSCRRNSTKSKLTASIGRDLESDSNDSYSESDSSSHSYAMLDKSSSNKAETVRADMSYIPESGCDISPSHHAEAFPSLSKKNGDSTEIDAKLQRETKVLSNVNELESSSGSKMQTSVNNFHDEFSQNNGELRSGDGSEVLTEEASSTASERQFSESSDETSDSSLSGSETDRTKRRKNISSKNEDEKSERQSTDNSDETSDSSLSESETVFTKNRESVSSRNEDKSSLNAGSDEKTQSSWINSEELPPKTRNTNIQSKETEDTPKKKLSNEKRLDALLEKRKSIAALKNVIKDALKDLDSGLQTRDGKKHIVFSDDGEGGDGGTVTEKPAYSVGEKISGSKASSWLGLVSDSDEGDDQLSDGCDEESAQLVTVKPHFEGKAGEELFKLQRTFGGDKRFDLDSRFLESEEDDEDDDDNHVQKETAMDDAEESFPTQEEVDIIGNLKQEKEMAMKVLSSILGGDFRAEFGHGENEEKVPEFRSSATIHYDPTREDHKQFEQADTAEKDEEKREAGFVKEMEPEDPVLPEVSQDKYYDANISSLTQLFGNKKQGASTFTFLSQGQEDDNDSTVAEDSRVESAEEIRKNPWQTTSKLPYDSSGDSDDGDDDDMVVDDTVNAGDPAIKFSSQLDELFFFHSGDPGLTNRINDETEPFMRTGSQEEVHEYWVSVRSELTQDYKRKRKDAVRRQNKLAAKRSRHR